MREKHIEIVRECEIESRLEQQGCKPSAIVKGHRIEISGQQKFVSHCFISVYIHWLSEKLYICFLKFMALLN